jgi:hypothetical protein
MSDSEPTGTYSRRSRRGPSLAELLGNAGTARDYRLPRKSPLPIGTPLCRKIAYAVV